MRSDDIGDVFAGLVKAQAEFPVIPKLNEADVGKFKYKYADLPTIISLVTPVLNKHGLGVMQVPEDGKLYTIIFAAKSAQWIAGDMVLPMNSSAQELGSWITYLRRYALTAMLGIAADEDDDGSAAQAAQVDPPKTMKPPPDPTQQPLIVSEFEQSIHDLFDEGTSVLIGRVDNPRKHLGERMGKILGAMGFERVAELTNRSRQKEFYKEMSDLVAEIKREHGDEAA
jgi:hypothetical protein